MRPGDVLDGRYELEGLVGVGGMGAVYRARDLHGQGLVAIKVLRGFGDEVAIRFTREAQLLAALRAPGIVGYYGFGKSPEGDPYMVLEWLEGETLRDRLERDPLSLLESVEVVIGIADALVAGHDKGVVHRDLKPANVFLVGNETSSIKVLDFGIARVLGERKGLTATGAVLGTPGYMAPEQVRGDKKLDVRCDVYAMGCILFRTLCGRPPFEAPDTVSLLMRTASEAAPRLKSIRPAVPDRLDVIVASMLRQKHVERPSNARVVAAELRAIANTLGSDLAAPSLRRAKRASAPPGPHPTVSDDSGSGSDDGDRTEAMTAVPASLSDVATSRHASPLGMSDIELRPSSLRKRPSLVRWVLFLGGVGVVVFLTALGVSVLVSSSRAKPPAGPSPSSAPSSRSTALP